MYGETKKSRLQTQCGRICRNAICGSSLPVGLPKVLLNAKVFGFGPRRDPKVQNWKYCKMENGAPSRAWDVGLPKVLLNVKVFGFGPRRDPKVHKWKHFRMEKGAPSWAWQYQYDM